MKICAKSVLLKIENLFPKSLDFVLLSHELLKQIIEGK